LCWTGFWAAGGAQLMLIVTLPLEELGAGVLEQAEAARLRLATAAKAAAMRQPASRYRCLLIDVSFRGAGHPQAPQGCPQHIETDILMQYLDETLQVINSHADISAGRRPMQTWLSGPLPLVCGYTAMQRPRSGLTRSRPTAA
jgi:hypothetical protein